MHNLNIMRGFFFKDSKMELFENKKININIFLVTNINKLLCKFIKCLI